MVFVKYIYHTIMRTIHWTPDKRSPRYIYHNSKLKGLLLILGVVLFLFNQPVGADTKTDEQQSIETAQKLLKSTVKVAIGIEHGTGFYVAPNVVITNTHVILKAPTNEVTLIKENGTTCRGTVGYREELVDLAVITTNCTGTPLPIATDADEGQTVIVSGNPLGFDFTITKGVISAFRSDHIQFDAKINYGSSGGVMANLSGEVVGVVTLKAKKYEYMGFAVPYDRVKQFIERSGINNESE